MKRKCVSLDYYYYNLLIYKDEGKMIEIFNNTFITRLPCQVSFNMILCIIPNIRSYMYFLWNYTTDRV